MFVLFWFYAKTVMLGVMSDLRTTNVVTTKTHFMKRGNNGIFQLGHEDPEFWKPSFFFSLLCFCVVLAKSRKLVHTMDSP